MAQPIANRPKLRRFGVALFFSGLLLPSRAGAQVSDVTRAEQLFDEARTLMKQGVYGQACARFEESHALNPGGGTILNLGICRRLEGRTATAHAILSEALEQAKADGRSDRMATAQKHLALLTPVLSRITVRASADEAPNLVVEVDGNALTAPRGAWTVALDPGVHEVRASAQGYEPWSVRVTLSPVADHLVVELPALKKAPEPTPLAAVQPPALELPKPPPRAPLKAAERPAAPPAPVASGPFPNAPEWLGYALTGGGGAAVGVGAYFGIRALRLKDSSDDAYDFEKRRCKTQSCVDDWNEAKGFALASNVFLGVGLVGLAGGAYFLFRPHSETPANRVTLSIQALPEGAQASASARF
jgi:hypothetical protein